MIAIIEIVVVTWIYLAIALFGMHLLASMGFITSKGGDNTATWAPLTSAAVINLLIAALVILAHLGFGGSFSELRAGVSLSGLSLALLGGGLILVVAATYARLCGARRSPASAGTGLVALLVLALFCAALMEEILFRAVIVGALMPYGLWTALFVSALIFALIHLPTNTVTGEAFAGWFIGGLAFAGAWLAGAPLVVVTLFHLGHNLGNVLWVQPAKQFGRVEKPDAPPALRLVRYGIDAAIIVAFAIIGYRWL